MSRQEKVWTIFVASPGDVKDERDRLERVVADINRTHSRVFGARFELFRWDRDVTPEFGADPQAVVNDQVPQDYDIFVGILWNRIGTPTGRASSGTLEEFRMAKERFDADAQSVSLMLYFKTTPPPNMDEFDPDQYKAVRAFKEEVQGQGVVCDFTTGEMYESAMREHLIRWLQARSSTAGEDEHHEVIENAEAFYLDPDEGYEDEGFLELEELLEEEGVLVNEALTVIHVALDEMSSELKDQTKELSDLVKTPLDLETLDDTGKRRLRVEGKRIAKKIAVAMLTFVKNTSQAVPDLRTHMETSVNALIRYIPVYLELNRGVDEQEKQSEIEELYKTMSAALDSLRGFQGSIESVPRLTGDLNRAKRQTEKVAQELVGTIQSSILSLDAVLVLFPGRS